MWKHGEPRVDDQLTRSHMTSLSDDIMTSNHIDVSWMMMKQARQCLFSLTVMKIENNILCTFKYIFKLISCSYELAHDMEMGFIERL